MGPGEDHPTQHLAPPPFSTGIDKLRWQKDARCWAGTVRACVDGGDGRARGMLAALGMLLYRSLPPSQQQLTEKSLETGEIVLDPSDPGYSSNVMDFIEKTINIVCKRFNTRLNQTLRQAK